MIPRYPTTEQIYDMYKRPNTRITFEGRTYKFAGIEKKGDVNRHIYRNEKERHTLTIHMQGGVPFYVDAWYIIRRESDATV